MTVLQLVFAGDSDARHLEPQPNPDQLEPAKIFRQGQGVFLAGSDDLISIALHLSLNNFRVLEFYIVDRFFVSIDEDEQERLSSQLIRLIESKNLEALWKFVDRYMAGRFVEQVRLLSGAGNSVTIAQQGVVHASEEDVAALRKGLSEVGNTL
jgi:hypothetical protein